MRSATIVSWLEFYVKARMELEDTAYSDRAHYSQSAYSQGCRGPLCVTAMADLHQERRYKEGKITYGELVGYASETADKFFLQKYKFIIGLLHTLRRPIPDALVYAAMKYGMPMTREIAKELVRDSQQLVNDAVDEGEVLFEIGREMHEPVMDPMNGKTDALGPYFYSGTGYLGHEPNDPALAKADNPDTANVT